MPGKEGDRQNKHEDGADHPVLNQREGKDLEITKDLSQLLVFHLGQGRVHHEDQPYGNGDVCGSHLKGIDEILDYWENVSGADSNSHAQEYPESQITIDK